MIINNQPDSFHSVTSYTVPYTTTSGITCFNRDSIAAVTEVSSHEIDGLGIVVAAPQPA